MRKPRAKDETVSSSRAAAKGSVSEPHPRCGQTPFL